MDDQQRLAQRPVPDDDTEAASTSGGEVLSERRLGVTRGTDDVDGPAQGRQLFADIDDLDPEVDEAGDLLPEDRRPADDEAVTTVPGPGGGNPNQPVVGIDDVAKGTRNP